MERREFYVPMPFGGYRERPAWLTYVHAWPVVFSEECDLIYIGVRVNGFGTSGTTTNWDSEAAFTWFGLDNLRLVPAEETWTGYDGWVKTYDLNADHALRTAAPFLDATPNLLKYALGLRGDDIADEEAMPRAWLNQPDNTFDYLFRRMQEDVEYVVEGTESLVPANWQPHATNPGEVGGEVTVPVALGDHDRLFLRLKVQD